MKGPSEIRIVHRLRDFRLEISARWEAPVVAIFGASGSGKTSILEILAGIRHADEAYAVLGGRTLDDSARGIRIPAERRGLGWVPQDASLFPHLSVEGNLRFGLSRSGDTAPLRRAIEMLEIGHLLGRRPAELSGGERQRVALARALASGPRGLLLDEPLASLDLPLRARIFPFLIRLRDVTALPMIYVTHDAGEATALATHVLVIEEGRLVASGSPDDLLRSPAALRLLDLVRLENRFIVREVTVREEDELVGLTTETGLILSAPRGCTVRPGEIVGIRSEEILIATGEVKNLSAQNVVPGVVESIHDQEGRCLLSIRCFGERIRSAVTRHAAATLGLVPGRPVSLVFKAYAIHRIGEGERAGTP